MPAIGRQSLELLSGLDHPAQDGIGVDLEPPRGAPEAQPFGQTRDDAPELLGRGALAMTKRAVRLIQISLAGHTRKLLPRLATGMAVGADMAAAEPTVIGAIRSRTEVGV